MPAKKKFSIKPIQRTDIFQEVSRRLDAFVFDASFNPGDRLPSERELAERMGVSRTSVRQALKILEASGKVVSRVGSGTYIADPAPTISKGTVSFLVPQSVGAVFLQQLINLRAVIEVEVFREFCRKMTSAHLEELAVLLEENQRDSLSHPDELISLDVSFEGKVGEFLGNEVLYCVQQQIHQAWILAWTRYGYLPEKKETLFDEHKTLLQALKDGNNHKVVQLIRQHVNKKI